MVPRFKFGDVREDGYRYIGRRFSRLKKDGTYGEDWRSPEGFEKQIQNILCLKDVTQLIVLPTFLSLSLVI